MNTDIGDQTMRPNKPAAYVFAASTFAAILTLSSLSHAQALQSDDIQLAAMAPQSSADACLQGLDRPMVDANILARRCTAYLGTANLSPGEQGAAHLVRAAAWQDLGEEAKATADNLEAVRLYSTVIDKQQPYPEFVFRRATAYHALGDVGNALKDYDAAIRANPWNVTAFADRGLLLARYESQYDLAILDFEQALTLSPDNVEVLILRGDAFAAKGKFAKAMADLDRAVALAPRNPAAYVHRAAAWSRQNKVDAALKDYATALSIDPDNVEALINRGALYAASGDGRTGLADLDRAATLAPRNAMALYDRGYAHFVARDYDRAIADYGAAIELAPGFALAYANRCLSRALAGGDRKTAMADCDRAVALMPALPDVRETRAFAALKFGDADLAIAEYDAALKLAADRPLALYGRGLARGRKGDVEGAKADRLAALALYPNVAREFTPYGLE